MGEKEYTPLYETKEASKGRFVYYRMFAGSILVAICTIWTYRAAITTQMIMLELRGERRSSSFELWSWIGLFCAEIWFGFYWILSQSVRWNPVYRFIFKDRLLLRYKKHELPKVDIFVCTSNPVIEPPIMVINTVLSVMAYDYPSEKLSIYLSDDGGSSLTFYALFEASLFAKIWLPYCRKYHIEPRSPAAYFASLPGSATDNAAHSRELDSIKKLYKEMEHRIETSAKLNQIPEDIYAQHKGFLEWDKSYTSKYDHGTILQILIDGRNPEAKDTEGYQLPTLVYVAREKRPQYFHNYKAGALNALIRVSSEISNGPIILNVDCDMHSNNSQSIFDALCFFMDDKSHGIAFVQFPQEFKNINKNDIYFSSLRSIFKVELSGYDGVGGPLYCGTGCFHKREVLCGKKYSPDYKSAWKMQDDELIKVEGDVNELELRAKKLASCTYELINSEWGKQAGLQYGCAVEDVSTGLAIHSRGWKSVYLNTKRSSFVGLAPTTLIDTLVQHKRWSEGQLQMMMNHCPLWHGDKMISLGHRLGYCYYGFWSLNSLATLCYCSIPSLCMLKGISLFPELSSPWLLPFGYIAIASYAYSLGESLCSGGTIREWWNEQRIWLYKRMSSYLFALSDTILKFLGFSDLKFAITTKVVNEDVSLRYENGVMEFGVHSPMFTILTCVAFVNLFTFLVVLKRSMLEVGGRKRVLENLGLQILLSATLILINWPLYEAIFLRKDKGKMPSSVSIKAAFVTLSTCILVISF